MNFPCCFERLLQLYWHYCSIFSKERKNAAKLTEALERANSDIVRDTELNQKCLRLEAQLKDATDKLAAHEVKVSIYTLDSCVELNFYNNVHLYHANQACRRSTFGQGWGSGCMISPVGCCQ